MSAAVGVPLLVIGVILFVAPIPQRMRSAEAWGAIVAITSTHQHVAAAFPPVSTVVHLPVIEFETNERRKIIATLTNCTVMTCMVGERVRLRYNRRTPNRIFVPTPFDWIIPAAVVALGTICIVISLVTGVN